MRTLDEILSDVQDGKRPDYEELRYALMAYRSLMTFDMLAFMRLAEAERENKRRILSFSAEWQWKEYFNRSKSALAQDPKVWIGWNNDPDNPEFQKRRKISLSVVEAAMKKAGV